MAYSVETKASNAANALRDALDQAERQFGQWTAESVEAYLRLLDQIEHAFTELKQEQIDLRSEEGRWQSLLSRLDSKPNGLVAAAARAGGLALMRAHHPPADSFWWHLDQEVARRRARTVRRFVMTILAVVVIVGGGYWLLNTLFPPDPVAVRMVETNAELEQLIATQDWQAALDLVMARQAELPDEPELILWEVVLAEQLDDQARAAAALARAKGLLPAQEPALLVQLGTFQLQVGNVDGATQSGQAALALAPENPQATFLLGNIAEATNDIPTAIEMFNRTFDLAEQDNPQLAVVARVRMGNLLQRAPAMQNTTTITSTDAPTATTPLTTP